MSFMNRVKFMFGILSVFLIAGGLFLYLNHSISRVTSRSAVLQAELSSVGTDFGGAITKQYVREGDAVKKGDKLFEIKSDSYLNEIQEGRTPTLPTAKLEGQNTIVLIASVEGIIREVKYTEGAYVADGSQIASIQKNDSTFLLARYRLSPSDYERLARGNVITVTMPDNQKISAEVYDITLQNNDGIVETVTKAKFINPPQRDYTFAVDTPVNTSLQLNGETLYQRLEQFTKDKIARL